MILSATVDTSALWSIIGIVVGLLGSLIFYILGQKKRKLIYTISSQSLITDNLSSIEGLQITYDTKPIKNLTSTTIVLKSIGNEIIQTQDFGKETPLCIRTTESFLLQEDMNSIVTANSNLGNLFQLQEEDAQTIRLNFDYLKKGDSITLTLLHTGVIGVTGKLKLVSKTHLEPKRIRPIPLCGFCLKKKKK